MPQHFSFILITAFLSYQDFFNTAVAALFEFIADTHALFELIDENISNLLSIPLIIIIKKL